MQRSKIILNLLVLNAVIALVLIGWITGHILRFSLPAFWHPPFEEITPQIQNGFESDGSLREIIFSENPDLRFYPEEGTTISRENFSQTVFG